MEGLHVAIADYLRHQWRSLVREDVALASPPGQASVPACRVCGAPVDDDEGGLYNLADMRTVRECCAHYCPF